MEVVGGSGAVDQLEISGDQLTLTAFCEDIFVEVVVGHLQKAHHSGRGVFGTQSVQPVGQKQSDIGGLVPFGLCGTDEVVENDLGPVEEVSELCFPNDQIVRVAQRVAVLEAQHALLAQMRVADHHMCLFLDALQRTVLARVLLIHHHRVPMAESASLHVLPAQTHLVPLLAQRSERQSLRTGPVQRRLRLQHRSSLLVHFPDLGVHAEHFSIHLLRDASQTQSQFVQGSLADRSHALGGR